MKQYTFEKGMSFLPGGYVVNWFYNIISAAESPEKICLGAKPVRQAN